MARRRNWSPTSSVCRPTCWRFAIRDVSSALALGLRPPVAVEARRSTAQWWWEFHQVAVSTVYALMIYPAWHARVWLPAPWGMLFFFAVLAAAATSVTVRLHLRFTARVYPAELPLQRARARPWTRWSDAGFSRGAAARRARSWRHASGSRHLVRRRVDRGRRRVLHHRTGHDESGVRR